MKLALKNALSKVRGEDAGPAPAPLERRTGETAFEELARLTEENRREPDPMLERRIVIARNDAFYELETSLPEGAPEQLAEIEGNRDPIRMEQGLPAIDAKDLNALTVRSALLSHGSLIVRGLLDPDRARNLAKGVDRAFDGRDGYEEGQKVEPNAWFDPFVPDGPDSQRIRGWGRFDPSIATVWLADSPRMLFDVLESFSEAGVQDMARDYLGEPPAFSIGKSVMRRVGIDGGGAWHQDGAFLGEGIRTLNVWTSLCRCGDVAPGMDVVPVRLNEILETGTEGAIFDWSISDQLVQEALGDRELARPIFDPGDALLFDHLCLHGTAIDEKMTETRHATETWCFAPSSYPENAVPLVISNH